jgi:hypothetical protein
MENKLARVLFRILCFAVSQFVAELGFDYPEKWGEKPLRKFPLDNGARVLQNLP